MQHMPFPFKFPIAPIVTLKATSEIPLHKIYFENITDIIFFWNKNLIAELKNQSLTASFPDNGHILN